LASNRRDFLKQGLAVLGAAASGAVAERAISAATQYSSAPVIPAGDPQPALTTDHRIVDARSGLALPVIQDSPRKGVLGRKWVMVIDLAACDGCGRCIKACMKAHFIPDDGRLWIKVLRMPNDKPAPYFPQPCYHCDNPPCTKVCPVDATFKRDDGVVLIDNERCIGCRFCMAACPYGARSFNWGHPHEPPEALAQAYTPERGFPRRVGTVEKCDFCPDMANMGMLPHCAAACPMKAIYFGDENEDAVTCYGGDTVRLSTLKQERLAFRLMEDLGTQPRVYYLATHALTPQKKASKT